MKQVPTQSGTCFQAKAETGSSSKRKQVPNVQMFKFDEVGTNLRSEVTAGITTVMTMAYIIFVQPAVLSVPGMDFGSVMVATCLASATATFLMGVLANYLCIKRC